MPGKTSVFRKLLEVVKFEQS